MGVGTLIMLGMLATPGQAPPRTPANDVVYPLNVANLDIPIRYDPAQKSNIRELLLYVSQNQGVSWEQAKVATPDKDSFFSFAAPADGTYYFQIVIVDKQGNRGPDPYKTTPALKVLIDTKPPAIAIKSFERAGEDATVSWDIQEPNPDWNKFQIDYRSGEGNWVPVAVKGSASGMVKFKVPQLVPLTVRIQAFDVAGNQGQATKDITPSSPVLASNDTVQQSSLRMNAPADVVPPPLDPVSPALPVIEPPVEAPKVTSVVPPPAAAVAPAPAPAPQARPDSAAPLAVSPNSTYTPAGMALSAPQIINVTRFDLAYDVEQKGPSGVGKAEVWVTRDDGKTWKKWSTTEKGESPVTVELATRENPQVEGVYGLKIVLQSGAGLSKGPPLSGEAPDLRVDVDLTPPVVKVYEPVPDPNQKDTMILRWQAVDRNLANDPITLEWAEQPDGPWNPIISEDNGTPLGTNAPMAVKRLPNTGQFSWRVPSNFPTHRVYLRVTARDMAGNVAEVRSPQPILVDMNKPVAHIHGIIGASSSERR